MRLRYAAEEAGQGHMAVLLHFAAVEFYISLTQKLNTV